MTPRPQPRRPLPLDQLDVADLERAARTLGRAIADLGRLRVDLGFDHPEAAAALGLEEDAAVLVLEAVKDAHERRTHEERPAADGP